MEDLPIPQVMEIRHWFYQFFAQCLFEIPQKEKMADYIKSNLFCQMIENGEENAGVRLLAKGLTAMKNYTDQDWKFMQEHYVALFANSGPILVYPWESVYTSTEHIIYDEHTLAVQEFYRKWGVERTDTAPGPVDHIGLECSFMALLTKRAIDSLKKQDNTSFRDNIAGQKEFLENHLLLFVDAFCQSLQEQTTMEFYKGLALFLQAYIETDAAELAHILANAE